MTKTLTVIIAILILGTVAQNCNLIIPINPLTAVGMATPYLLSNTTVGQGCNQASSGTAAFVQGAVLNTDTGEISTFNPLVINRGTAAAIYPQGPTLPVHSIVALWFGFNGATLTLKNRAGRTDLTTSNCTIGSPAVSGDTFGQFAACNAATFFTAAAAMVAQGKLKVPTLATALDGKPCPTIRDFFVVDQDQSDNVLTTYLVKNNKLAQSTAANKASLGTTAVEEVNGSDNRLVDNFILPALGCSPWQVKDLADSTQLASNLATNEILANYRQGSPVALVPANDPMVKLNGNPNLVKLNAYRASVFQPQVSSLTNAPLATYCNNLNSIAIPRLTLNKARFQAAKSPTSGTNLYDFLKARLITTFGPADNGGVGCADIGILMQALP